MEKLTKTLNDILKYHLESVIPDHHIRDVYNYAVFPVGKLFRPKIACSIASDFSKDKISDTLQKNSPLSLLCAALEIHHAYTLVHDDLPCMDDDDERRGKPTVHKQYGEWKALLVGDGLINASYLILSKINSQNLPYVFHFFSWALGPKGLIQGQVLDLAEEMNLSFSLLIQTHELKTARLIQVSMLCSYLLIENKRSSKHGRYRTLIDLMKLGRSVGLAFQFLDDLSELTSNTLSDHEKSINPWINFHNATQLELEKSLSNIETYISKYSLKSFKEIMQQYFELIGKNINKDLNTIKDHLNDSKVQSVNLTPLIGLLNRFNLL